MMFDDADAESTAVKLPLGAIETKITGIALRTPNLPSTPVEVALVRAFFLDEGYRPRPPLTAPAVCRLSAGAPCRVVWARQ